MEPLLHVTLLYMAGGAGGTSALPCSFSGMKSVSVAIPEEVRNKVWSILVFSMYRCSESKFSEGCTAKCPPLSISRMLAKMLGDSMCGRQHQSMEPSLLTRAQVSRSPMIP